MKFEVDDRVKIRGFPDGNFLNGATGTILGTSWDTGGDAPGWKAYIVLLDKAIPEAKAISVTNSCLERV